MDSYEIIPPSYRSLTNMAIDRIVSYANAPLAIHLLDAMCKTIEIINKRGGVSKEVWEEIRVEVNK